MPVFFASKQCGKTSRGIKAGPAQPIDGAVIADQGSCFTISYQGVLLNPF